MEAVATTNNNEGGVEEQNQMHDGAQQELGDNEPDQMEQEGHDPNMQANQDPGALMNNNVMTSGQASNT